MTENGIALFGFLSEEEKVLFEKLIGVSKVGPKMALAALSTFSPAELADAIASQDIARVSHIPGWKKTAERIILELKGTLEAGMESLFSQGRPSLPAARRCKGLPRRFFPWASRPPKPRSP
ncbi:MAG: Holliday junction branch migration protein RuvA [Adlercreutzia equolifaciens]